MNTFCLFHEVVFFVVVIVNVYETEYIDKKKNNTQQNYLLLFRTRVNLQIGGKLDPIVTCGEVLSNKCVLLVVFLKPFSLTLQTKNYGFVVEYFID